MLIVTQMLIFWTLDCNARVAVQVLFLPLLEFKCPKNQHLGHKQHLGSSVGAN